WKRHRFISSGVTPGKVPTRETSHSSLKRNFRSFGCASAGIVMSSGGATSVLLLYRWQAVLIDCFDPSKITPGRVADGEPDQQPHALENAALRGEKLSRHGPGLPRSGSVR